MVVADREQGRVFALARRDVADGFRNLPVMDAVAKIAKYIYQTSKI